MTTLEQQCQTGVCDYMVIRGANGLDPVTAIFRDDGDGKGQLVVTCSSQSWNAYWSAMGDNSVREFVHSCGRDYIVNKLTDYSRKQTKADERYLEKIVDVIKGALSKQVSA